MGWLTVSPKDIGFSNNTQLVTDMHKWAQNKRKWKVYMDDDDELRIQSELGLIKWV